MRELLSKWSELEPERCFVDMRKDYIVACNGLYKTAFEKIDTHNTRMRSEWIQGSVQEAMVAHRMTGGVRCEKLPSGAYSWIARAEWDGVGCNTGGDLPAYTLLACYLDRLEAKIKSEVAG